MLGDILAIAVVGGIAAICIRNLVRDHKKGEKCACTGDCDNCKIQRMTNEAYYGVQRKPNS